MKTKKILITVIVILLTIATTASAFFFARKNNENKSQKENESVTDVSSKTESDEIKIEVVDKEENNDSKDEGKFIVPDETEANKLLEEHSSKVQSSASSETEEKKPTESKTESVVTDTLSKPVVSKPQKEKEEKKQTASSAKKESVKTESKKTESKKKDNGTQTFEEGKKELEDTANDYLKKNKIDPKTAGETGEICPNCSKKIWNPDKYGFFIPGMPDDYENSGYCLGTCGITLE